MAKETNKQLDRVNPLMLYNILVAVRRFEPDFYAHLCRSYHLDADRILGLFASVDELGAGQLISILRDLRAHMSYHDIVYLAGRNALAMYTEQHHIKLKGLGSLDSRIQHQVKQLLPRFLGQAKLTMMLMGKVHFIEVRDSIFARNVTDTRPVCGFYAGLLAELGTRTKDGPCTVTEVTCSAMEADAPHCTFQLAP